MKDQDKNALRLSVGVLFLSLFALWICKSYLQIEISAFASLIIFVPLITFLTFSGKMKSFKYGQLEATLNENVASAMDTLDVEKISILAQDIGKQKSATSQKNLQAPLIYSIVLGTPDYNKLFKEPGTKFGEQKDTDIIDIFYEIDVFPRYTHIAFVDNDERLIGYIALYILRNTLRNSGSQEIFLDFIKYKNTQSIKQLGIQTASVDKDENALETLRQMNENNEQYIAVVDYDQRIIGILQRADLTSKLLVQLIDEIEGVKIRRIKKNDTANN